MGWEDAFNQLSARQEGLVGRFQLPRIGATGRDFGRAPGTGRWDQPARNVVRNLAVPPTDAQRLLIPILNHGPLAVLGAESTLAWMGIGPWNLRRLHIVGERGRWCPGSDLAEVHQLRDLRAVDIMEWRGVPTLTAGRAIWMIMKRYAGPRADQGFAFGENLVDQANRLNLLTWEGLRDMVEDLQKRGRQGTVILRAISDKREPGTSPNDTRLEDHFEKRVAGASDAPFLRQREVGGAYLIGRGDFRDPRLPLVLEVNSLIHHTLPTDRARDERRYAALNLAGFAVAVVWEPDVFSKRDGLIRTVRLGRRLAQLGRAETIHSPGCPWPDQPTIDDLEWP